MDDRLDVLQFLIASGSDLTARNEKNETLLSLLSFGESPSTEKEDEIKTDEQLNGGNNLDSKNSFNSNSNSNSLDPI